MLLSYQNPYFKCGFYYRQLCHDVLEVQQRAIPSNRDHSRQRGNYPYLSAKKILVTICNTPLKYPCSFSSVKRQNKKLDIKASSLSGQFQRQTELFLFRGWFRVVLRANRGLGLFVQNRSIKKFEHNIPLFHTYL